MKPIASLIAPAGLLLALGLSAQAQFAPRAEYSPSSVSTLVGRVHSDLNNAYGAYNFKHEDRERLNNAEKELRQFSRKWDNGNFDKDELNDAISGVQHVLNSNNLPASDRDALSYDVNQLRNMRDAYNRHEIRGAHH